MASNVNQVDDDLNNLAKTYLNQPQNVIARGSGVATTISSTGRATGTVASPGPSGLGGAGRPGKRLYNPLSKLASYTYNLSLYVITPDAYEAFVNNGRQKIDALSFAGPPTETSSVGPGAYLVAQSGGINNTTQRRAPGFELDYYIDNLNFTNTIGAQAIGSATSLISEVKFNITEPYGFSFLTNLKKATDALKQYSDSTSYKDVSNDFKQIFILGIRFYGYDINGNLIMPQDELYGSPIDPVGTDALFENYYDLQIVNVTFKLDGRSVVYTVEAVGLNAQALLGVKRGRMATGLKIQGATVDDALQGLDGLFTKLNKMEQEKVNKKNATFPNVYRVEYLGDAFQRIGKASIVTKSDLDKSRWPGSGARTTAESNDSQGTKPPDPNERMFNFNNDTSIISAIEQIVKKSSYIEQSMNSVYTNAKQPDTDQKNNPQVVRDNPVPLAYFAVNLDIVGLTWDPKLQDWAYEQVFVITVYDVPSVMTPFAPDPTRYYGPHKRYDYYFTGQNSEILDYSLTFNNVYFNTVLGMPKEDFKILGATSDPGAERPGQDNQAAQGSGSATGNTQATANSQGQRADPPPPGSKDNSAGSATAGGTSVTTGVRSNGDRTGALGVGLEAQNQLITSLQDEATWSNGTIKILGDPDYLMRDSATSLTEFYNKFYDTDGYTISASGGQVFIEVAFKEAVDYKNSTGLMEINDNVFFINYPQYIKDMAQGAVIWTVTQVKSTFNTGTFTQILTLAGSTFAAMGEEGDYDPSSGSQTADPVGGESTSDPDALGNLETEPLEPLNPRED
jgi:hypothetical protein